MKRPRWFDYTRTGALIGVCAGILATPTWGAEQRNLSSQDSTPAEATPAPTKTVGQSVDLREFYSDGHFDIERADLEAVGEQQAEAMAWYAEGLRLERHDRNPDATTAALLKAVELAPTYVDGHIKVVLRLLSRGESEKALVHLESALLANPKTSELKAAHAYALRIHGDNDQALEIAKSLVSTDPAVIMPYRVIFEVHAERGHLDQSLKVIEELVGEKSRDAKFWKRLAGIYEDTLKNERPQNSKSIAEQVLPLYEKARQRGADDQKFLMSLADCHTTLGNRAKAIKVLLDHEKSNEPSAEVEWRLGNLYRLEQNVDKALAHFQKAFDLRNSEVRLGEMLTHLYLQEKRPQDAIAVLEKMKRRSSATPALYGQLARLLNETGRTDEAIDVLREAVNVAPQNIELMGFLAETYETIGQREKAVEVLEKALRRSPANGRLLMAIAKHYDESGDFPKAESSYLQAIQAAPNLLNSHMSLAMLYMTHNRPADATEVVAKARSRFPLSARLVYLEAIYARQNNDGARALRLLDQTRAMALGDEAQLINDAFALEYALAQEMSQQPAAAEKTLGDALLLKPDSLELEYHLARLQLVQEEYDRAAETLAKSKKKFPQATQFLFLSAVNERERKNFSAAMADLEQVRTLATKVEGLDLTEGYFLELGLTQELAGDLKKSEVTLADGLKRFPESHMLLNALAYLWADQGTNLDRALVMSEESLESDPDNGAYLDTLGWIYFMMDEPKKALPLIQQAMLATENDPVVEQHLGEIYAKLGDLTRAVEIWEAILEREPENKDVRALLNAARAEAKATEASSLSSPGE